ncbi:hypothetical protein NL676_035185 [Syzygium grande]|nr:hypothetical protein NL676_035185 [Syzygium grande]
MSLSAASSQDITYSNKFPANLQILSGPCSLILKSCKLATLKLNPFTGPSIFDVIAVTEHLEVNKDLAFCFVSKRLERSKPDDISKMNSNALKNFGDRIFSDLIDPEFRYT